MDPKDFFKTAEKLKDSDTESDLRTSVSRSYYAIFLYFRDYLAKLGLKKKDEKGMHFFIQACLSNSKIKKAQELSEELKILCNKRSKADYDLSENIIKSEADDVYDNALEAIKDFRISAEDEKELVKNVRIAGELNNWF